MTIFADSPFSTQSLSELYPRRASMVRLLADIEHEILQRGGYLEPITTNTCGHPNAAPAVLGPNGSIECSFCARKRQEAEEAARKAQPTRLSDTELAWANRDLDGELAREWRE